MKTTVLVVCEGEKTERNYLDQLKREDSATERFAVTVKSARGKLRVQIVQFAIDRKDNSAEPFDEVWCVMDIEKMGNPAHLADLRKSVDLAHANEIVLYLSNPAFEVWLLAHFVRTASSFNDCDAVMCVLNKHWQKEFGQHYNKSDGQIYGRLAPNSRKAITSAQWVRETHHRDEPDIVKCNSSTEFYKLVKRLLNPSGS